MAVGSALAEIEALFALRSPPFYFDNLILERIVMSIFVTAAAC
jgi:hypothetical protein